jgi:hypothetical protein
MTIEFSTEEYRFSHGRAPRGFGGWAFEYDGGEPEFITPSMTYTDAKKIARKIAKERQVTRVNVCP